jgi:uridine phosphorylase
MPKRLRPTAPIAAAAVLVGDPGRALLLAQDLLEEPKMCNHARGLWGYTGLTPASLELTIQATGMGGPSAAIVLADLAELGVRRAVRVGTCVAIDPALETGELLHAAEALAPREAAVLPDLDLSARLERELGGEATATAIVSLDCLPTETTATPSGVSAADLQTATVLSRCRALGIAAAAILIVEEARSERLGDGALEQAAKRAGAAAARAFLG